MLNFASGMSADLVCMAAQPLHSVPLLKVYGKFTSPTLIGDDYRIPHWINHSFYTSTSWRTQRNGFIPRIKVPDVILQYQEAGNLKKPQACKKCNEMKGPVRSVFYCSNATGEEASLGLGVLYSIHQTRLSVLK